nr:unnamed protein product [Spirometra erinaceieuropaei]
MRAVKTIDPLSLVAEHCADCKHTFAIQNAKILGRDNDRVAREAIEAWHTETTSINRCVALGATYQALQPRFNEIKSKREVRTDANPNTGEPTTDLQVDTPQIGPDEGAVINTVASITTPADEEKRGQKDAIKTSNPNAEILGRGNDRVAGETTETWHTGTNSINRCVALLEACQALRTQLTEQKSKYGPRGDRNPTTARSMRDTNAAALQLGSGEGVIVTTAAAPTYMAGENAGGLGVVKKIASLGRELRSMKTRAMTASARAPALGRELNPL